MSTAEGNKHANRSARTRELFIEAAQHRMFLAVSITFHSIAEVCRAAEADGTSRTLQNRHA